LGLLSITMLIWIDHLSQRQHMHFARADALMDLRIRAATSHLWLEEALAHQVGELERAWADLSDAKRFAEVLLNGGETESGMPLAAMREPSHRQRVEELRQLLAEFERNARERVERPEVAGVGSPLENRTDEIFDALQRRADELEKIVERKQAADHASARRLVLGIFLAWSMLVVASATGLVHRERRRVRAEAALQSSRDELERRVTERTQELKCLNDQLVRELHKRGMAEACLKESEEHLRDLSARLLTAQETERKRISAELHDHLGHALALLKLRLGQNRRLCRAAAGECLETSGEECRTLSQSIDHLIEDVRRISRDLSPSILVDMGLTAALRWLVDNHAGTAEIRAASSFPDVDLLCPPHGHILVFRVMQEALTNATKHAQATCVRLAVKRHVDWLSFVVEDDGKGFDPKKASMRNGSDRGLGLVTMDERARMLGGSLTVWSELGRGTRVSLAVPVKEAGGG
jgi:signal transduction histidine kinase